MTRLLVVDPGVATGWCTWECGKITGRGELDQMQTCEFASVWVGQNPAGVVICESFRITQETIRKSRQTASLEIIGVLRWLASSHGHKFVLQTPADAKRFMTDAKLRSLDWYSPTTGGHTNDALRHLGLYLAKTEHNQEVLRANA